MTTIRLSDYIANFLSENGIQHVFMLTGGGAMHLNDSLGKHPKLTTIFNHHEQASAIGAESYARLLGKPAVVNVTTGPGGLNALTGVFGAWTDSIPMMIISGQVKYITTVESTPLPLRQLGDQEYNIIASVKPMTKYAVMVTDPKTIKYHLQKALYLATHGRPGPVWLDIPLDLQGAMIDENELSGFIPEPENLTVAPELIANILQRIKQAKHPVILAGGGIRTAGVYTEFLSLVDQLKIPVTTAWNAHDLIANEHPYYAGRPGIIGDRAGNFAVQNADLLLVLGSRLSIRQVSYDWKTFARAAYKIMVDVDDAELQKPTLSIDLPIHTDLKIFMKAILSQLQHESLTEKSEWIAWCKQRVSRYPTVLPEYWQKPSPINPYCFMQKLGEIIPDDAIVVCGNGTACVTAFQAMPIKQKTRLYTNSGCAAMGYGLPAAIGACIAANHRKTICITGDGSIQMNLQELETVVFNQLPIKLFVLNNNGYHSIRQTQSNFFGEPLVGCDDKSGLGFPNFQKLATAYELPYMSCKQHDEMDACIEKVLASEGPVLCELIIDPSQSFEPKAASKRLSNGQMVSRPLEDMAPFLSKEELQKNMLIPLINEG